MKKINEGTSVSVDRPMVDAMKRALAVYRKIFTGKASSKLLNGVPLARWTYNRLKQETDKEKLLKIITQKFSVLTPNMLPYCRRPEVSRVTGPGRLKSFWENCLTIFLRIDYVFGAVVIIAPL